MKHGKSVQALHLSAFWNHFWKREGNFHLCFLFLPFPTYMIYALTSITVLYPMSCFGDLVSIQAVFMTNIYLERSCSHL